MDKYILDTNLFFNMEEGIGLGGKTEEVVKKLTVVARKKVCQFFMPPRAVEEFLSFFEDKEQVFIKEFFSTVTIKSPDLGKISFPADVFYRLIDDIRNRSFRGLKVSEEEILLAGKLMMGKEELANKDFQIQIGKVIKNFRERYRQATRYGFLDSLTDLDLIVLAKETDAMLVSTDEGVVKWGRFFGVKEIAASVFGAKMREHL